MNAARQTENKTIEGRMGHTWEARALEPPHAIIVVTRGDTREIAASLTRTKNADGKVNVISHTRRRCCQLSITWFNIGTSTSSCSAARSSLPYGTHRESATHDTSGRDGTPNVWNTPVSALLGHSRSFPRGTAETSCRSLRAASDGRLDRSSGGQRCRRICARALNDMKVVRRGSQTHTQCCGIKVDMTGRASSLPQCSRCQAAHRHPVHRK